MVASNPPVLSEELPFTVLRSTWQPVINAVDLPPHSVAAATLLGEALVLARFPDGSLLAARQACPHKGFDLSRSTLCGGRLQCAYHGWRFNSRGECEDIPSLVNPPANKLELSHLQNFPVQERYGMIWVRLDEREICPLPDVPEFEDPAWTYLVAPPMRFRSGFRREIENYLDMTHFAFAHSTTLGVAANPVVPPMHIEEYADGFLMDAPFPALETPHEQPGKLQQAHRRRQRCYLPNFTTIRQSFHDGDERLLIHIPSPISEEECNVFWALAISPGFRGPEPASQMEFATRVLNEDREMCENQWPREVPINPAKGGWGVLVTPGDTLANTFQKTLRKWLLFHGAGGDLAA
jgi:phenylpropionate dioxygenase-like ring-hydroxylating dioxygenase large terminal subunit